MRWFVDHGAAWFGACAAASAVFAGSTGAAEAGTDDEEEACEEALRARVRPARAVRAAALVSDNMVGGEGA